MKDEALDKSRPLTGTTVLEVCFPDAPLCIRLASALSGRIAADFGALVVRIEPDDGEPSTNVQPSSCETERSMSAVYEFLNAGKTVVKTTDRIEVVRQFIEKDVAALIVEEGDVVGSIAAERGVPVVEFAGWPASMADERAPLSEFTVLAIGGLLAMTGEPEREPLRLGGHQVSYSTGLAGFSALAAILAARDAQRSTESARVSLVETMLWVNWKAVCGANATGQPPLRKGDRAEFQVVPCLDGFVAIVYTASRFPDVAKLLGDARLHESKFSTKQSRDEHAAELYEVIRAWCSTRTRAQIYREAQDGNVPFGPVFDPTELLTDAQFIARDFFATINTPHGSMDVPRVPILWNKRGFSPMPRRQSTVESVLATLPHRNCGQGRADEMPLSGIRVIDFGQLTAGANTAAMLADLGADVIKVESAANLDLFRLANVGDKEHGWWNRSALFRFSNRNKRGVSIDLKTAEGNRIIRDLIDQSHVVVENFRRGVLERLGIDYPTISSTNPKIVLASISSQGETGPNREHISFGSTLDATGGLASITGYAEGRPVITGGDINYPDQIVSLFAAGAVISAVKAMRSSGKGAHLDISQREVASFLIGEEFAIARTNVKRGSLLNGNAEAGILLQDCVKCLDDRWIAVTLANEDDLARAAGFLETERSVVDVESHLKAWCATHTSYDSQRALRACGIAVAVVLDGMDHLENPRLRGNTSVWTADGRLLKGMPYVFGGRPFEPGRPAPDLGEHTEEILRDVLGRSPDEIDRLTRSGVTRNEPRAESRA